MILCCTKNDLLEEMEERSKEDRTREGAQARLCKMIRAEGGNNVNGTF